MAYASIKPAMLQIEAHPFLTQEKLLKVCEEYGIPVTAFSPFGALSYVELSMANLNETVFDMPAIRTAAERLSKTPAQIVLRWGIQRGTAVIPKTVRTERMLENLSVMDFVLTDAEMHAISDLNKNRRFNDPGVFCEAAFNTLYPIYD